MGSDALITIIVFSAFLDNVATVLIMVPIIIGSKVGLTFNQFAGYLFIPVVLSTIGVIAYFWASNRAASNPSMAT